METCQICDGNMRHGRLKNRHMKCQKKTLSRVKNGVCMLCDNKARDNDMLNILCDRHFKNVDDVRLYVHRPKTASLQDALDYFLKKRRCKN